MGRRPDAGGAVGVRVIGRPGHSRREHEQDGRDERDVGRRGLADEVEHDDEQERPDRDVGRGGVERVAEPDAVEEILDRADRPEEGAEPAVVEVPQRGGPAVLGGDDSGDQTTHARYLPGECIHRPSTSARSSGITFGRIAASSWTSPLWWPGSRPYISSCPKGQVEPPDRFEE